jgi:hypothetical protein
MHRHWRYIKAWLKNRLAAAFRADWFHFLRAYQPGTFT